MNLIEKDKAERLLALDASQSFIVQAPAGSGKTELLIQRFLTLLTTVKTPEEILAITFTKKAANEMRARIIKALKQAQSEPEPSSPHAKQTWQLGRRVLERDKHFNWNILGNPNQLRLQTIDALCTFITKQLPLLSHFGSQPDIAVNPTSLYQEAVQEILMHVEENYDWSHAISQLLLHLDNDLNKLHDLLVGLLAKRDQWMPYLGLHRQDVDIKAQLEKHLASVINESLTSLAHSFPKDKVDELLSIARFAADNLIQINPDAEGVACRDLMQLPRATASDLRAWRGLAQLLLTKTFTFRKQFSKDIGFPPMTSLTASEKPLHKAYQTHLQALIQSLSEREDLRANLQELFSLPQAFYQDDQWEILKSLLYLLKIVAAQLRLTFQQHGQIDFIENANAALSALGTQEAPTDLALALDYQIRHILLDEFQDTSITQFHLLEKLITGWEPHDGRTLFVVGDPMQSIYRFREAEVGLFIRMRKQGIGNLTLHPLTLSVNFRSQSSIVDWNNKHFDGLFPSFNDMATGAVTYSHSVAHQKEATQDAHITVRGFVDEEEKGLQAEHIVSAIYETQQLYPKEKIAILVRSRSHLASIIPALKKARIAYRAVDIDLLASRQSILDLLSLTSALLHPADRIAWLAVLRAPWCGLSLADLFILANANPYGTLWEQLDNANLRLTLSADGQQRINRIWPILKSKMLDRERDDLRYWIESTWLLLGGAACLQTPSDIDDIHAFFDLLSRLSEQQTIINMEVLKESINKLFASTQHDDASVQIMTIHTAKGLEFDTVILPHLERKMPSDDKALMQWMEQPLTNEQTALLLAPIHATGSEKDSIYEYISKQQKMKSFYETDRLLYVATTRAKKRLYLFYNLTPKGDDDYRVEPGSFLEKLWPFFRNSGQVVRAQAEDNAPLDVSQEKKTQRLILRLALSWQTPIQAPKPPAQATHYDRVGFKLTDDKPKLIGIVLHRILQHLSLVGTDWWQCKSPTDRMQYLSQQLRQQGIALLDLPHATDIAYHAILNTLQDERGAWILKKRDTAKSEYALTCVLDDKPNSLVIDRTFIDEDGLRWIIDYKTTAFNQADLTLFLDHEQAKYVEKMQTYLTALQLIEERPTKLGLYFPALPAWREW